MSDLELAAIHEKTSAILEKLYDENGQADEAFVQKYFELVQDINLGEPGEEAEDRTSKGPHKTDAKLSGEYKGLIDVLIPSKGEKFVVSNVASGEEGVFLCETCLTNMELVKTLSGTSQRFGGSRAPGTYLMTTVKGIPNITIKSKKSIITVSHSFSVFIIIN